MGRYLLLLKGDSFFHLRGEKRASDVLRISIGSLRVITVIFPRFCWCLCVGINPDSIHEDPVDTGSHSMSQTRSSEAVKEVLGKFPDTRCRPTCNK